MMIAILPGLFERELNKLKEEINLYNEEKDLWQLKGEISNCAGNLCLHLVGNLNHFIGSVLSNTGYIRKRDDEFTLKDIPRVELVNSINLVIQTINTTFSRLKEDDMKEIFPLEKHGEKVTTAYLLLHLLTHLNYHVGQVNYHRRMIN